MVNRFSRISSMDEKTRLIDGIPVSRDTIKKVEELKEGDLVILGRNYVDHTLKKLKPIHEDPKAAKAYIFKTDYPIKIGHDIDYKFFVNPDSGPLLSEGVEINALTRSIDKIILEKIKIESISYSEKLGYIVTIE